jgi:hypothetical protein
MRHQDYGWGWDIVLATLAGITHEARLWSDGSVRATCGVPCGKAVTHGVSMFTANRPEIDCMACIAMSAA